MRRVSRLAHTTMTDEGVPIAGRERETEGDGESSDFETKPLDRSALLERLVASGLWRLSAERTAVIQGADEEPGRARHRRPLRG
jgi:hypothetical protein